jgi:branched-chain amino acid transport system permease protein
LKPRLHAVLPFAGFAFGALAVQLLLRFFAREYYLTQITMSMYYAIVVMGLCLVMGYAGQVSLGHGAFFAIGGYGSAVLTTYDFGQLKGALSVACVRWMTQLHLLNAREDSFGGAVTTAAPWAAFLFAMLLTLAAAFLIGYPGLRLKGHYLAMATLGFGLIVNKLVLGSTLTGSADGVNGVPPWTLGFGITVSSKSADRVENYYVAATLVLVVLILLRNLIQSRIGRALLAIHDRETAANAMGINTPSYKLRVFVLSALLAAVAGSFFTHYTGGIGPSEAGALKSVRYVALAAAGGMSSLWGVTGVSLVLNYLSLRGFFGSYDNAVFGVLLILIVSVAPDGPLRPMGRWLAQVMGRRASRGTA